MILLIMQQYPVPPWKTAPFIRLLLPLLAGIAAEWYIGIQLWAIITSFSFLGGILILFEFLSIEIRYRLQWLQGLLINLIIATFAMLLVWRSDARNNLHWYGHFYNDSSRLIVHISEPPVEKAKSVKAECVVEAVINNGKLVRATGKIILYLSKDSNTSIPVYGSRVLVSKKLQPIKNSGNPGAFNYERYAAFHQLFHNSFLKKEDWVLLDGKAKNSFRGFIFSMQQYVVKVLHQYIAGSGKELGIAEALLIGYKEDLDKDLVQAYSNAGVVHIIAISGLHLGLIYIMLSWILDRFPVIRKSKFFKVLILLACLWLFALLTGASGSVLRSAVMFTFILIGKNYFRQASVYNSLAGSAFLLLCYDPYLLWDVGFQLSYLALVGIVWLQRPINTIFFIRQKWLAKIWELSSVTLAAQVMTFPACIYYFHQFPNLFFITNLLAVPLSTVILFAEIILISISSLRVPAIYAGKMITYLLWLMNTFITRLNSVSFSVWDGIFSNIYSTWALYGFVIACCSWLLYRHKKLIHASLVCLLLFLLIHLVTGLKTRNRLAVVVYNIPQHQAVDFINGNTFYFEGDSVLRTDGILKNFHLKPGRIYMKLNQEANKLNGLERQGNFFSFHGRTILLIDTSIAYKPIQNRIPVDILLISKNPGLSISGIVAAVKPSMVVFDASNSLWKIAKWKKECEGLILPSFSIPEQGAFVFLID